MDNAVFDQDHPRSVHDILWAWSDGEITTKQAIDVLEFDDVMELYEAALDNDIPVPGKPSPRDVQLAEEFVTAVRGAA